MNWVAVVKWLLQVAFVAVCIALPIAVYWFLGWLAVQSIKSHKPHYIFMAVMAIIIATLLLVGVGMEFVEYWQEISG